MRKCNLLTKNVEAAFNANLSRINVLDDQLAVTI